MLLDRPTRRALLLGGGALLALGAAAWLAVGLWARREEGPVPQVTDLGALFYAGPEIEAATARYDAAQPALVLAGDRSKKGRVAIVVDGLPERTRAAQLLDLFAGRGVPVLFFVEGQNAADAPEALKLINDAGQEIGNYTDSGVARLEELPRERAIGELATAQKVILSLTGHSPALFRAPGAKLTPGLLRAAGAVGLLMGVRADARVAPASLGTPAAAKAFVAALAPGSIIALDMAEPLEWAATDPPGPEEMRPAVDMLPTVKDPPPPWEFMGPPRPSASPAQGAGFLLDALGERGWAVGPLLDVGHVREEPPAEAPQAKNAPKAAKAPAAKKSGHKKSRKKKKK